MTHPLDTIDKAILEQNALAMLAFAEKKPIQRWPRDARMPTWMTIDSPSWDFEAYNYRPAPTPVTRNWNCAEDVPGPVCWLRLTWDAFVSEHLIGQINSNGLRVVEGSFFKWGELPPDAKHSTDRKTWAPCSVEEDGN